MTAVVWLNVKLVLLKKAPKQNQKRLQKSFNKACFSSTEHVLQHCCDVWSLYFSSSHRPAVSLEPRVFGFGGRCHRKDTASHRYRRSKENLLNISQSRHILASVFHLLYTWTFELPNHPVLRMFLTHQERCEKKRVNELRNVRSNEEE